MPDHDCHWIWCGEPVETLGWQPDPGFPPPACPPNKACVKPTTPGTEIGETAENDCV